MTEVTQTAPAVLAMDIVNAAIQREIELSTDAQVQLELALIKLEINRYFDKRRRGVA